MPRATLSLSRQIHLYFGVFITPAILFFALTGAIQTAGLHETNRDHPTYVPAKWIAVLAQIHKKQVATLPVRRPQPTASPAAAPQPQSAAPPPSQGKKHNPIPMRLFFFVVCLGLFTSTLTGLYMTYKFNRNKALITATLLAGTILPPLLLLF